MAYLPFQLKFLSPGFYLLDSSRSQTISLQPVATALVLPTAPSTDFNCSLCSHLAALKSIPYMLFLLNVHQIMLVLHLKSFGGCFFQGKDSNEPQVHTGSSIQRKIFLPLCLHMFKLSNTL